MFTDYFQEMRLKQWYKAAIVFSGPLFAGQLFINFSKLILAFLSFGFIASTVYVMNDIKDFEKDRLHPKKKNRPIASGRISRKNAMYFAMILFALAFYLGWASGSVEFIASYYLLMWAYTHKLKQIAIVDAFAIAMGFLLRAVSGCFVAGISITPWFYLTIFFFAIYLAFCKRLSELKIAEKGHKESLEEYEKFVEIAISISGALVLAIYAMYAAVKGRLLIWSVPLSFLGLLLHLQASMRGEEVHESLKNPVMILTGIMFTGIVLLATLPK